MAKKIIGSSKLGNIKVAQEDPQFPEVEKKGALNLISKKKKGPTMRSYRLHKSDMANLRLIAEQVNELTEHKRVTETDIVKALALLGLKMKPEQILRAVKEVVVI